jgi:uncharacterized protein
MTKSALTSGFTVNVRELLRSPGTRREFRLRAPLPDVRTPVAAVEATTPVEVAVDVAGVVDGLLVTGEVSAAVRLSCVRCLSDVGDELHVPVEELFVLDPAAADDEGYTIQAGELLPLETMARDALVLAFPAAPLCRPDCAGLCPTCGADRNESTCDHTEAVDPRWAALAQLVERDDNRPRR